MEKFHSSNGSAYGTAQAREVLGFGATDSEHHAGSLPEIADRDLEAILQLLVQRARYLTGASGAAIILREGKDFLCRVTDGPCAPVLSEAAQISGLLDECARTHEIARCDDIASDPQANDQLTKNGIRSLLLIPLIRDSELIGAIQLAADRVEAFEEQDVAAMERLSEMVLTSIEHADATKRGVSEIAAADLVNNEEVPERAAEPSSLPAEQAEIPTETVETLVQSTIAVRKCQACGFPVSEGRSFCLDCEAAGHSAATHGTPSFGAKGPEAESWLESNFYTLATLLVIALTVLLLAWKVR